MFYERSMLYERSMFYERPMLSEPFFEIAFGYSLEPTQSVHYIDRFLTICLQC